MHSSAAPLRSQARGFCFASTASLKVPLRTQATLNGKSAPRPPKRALAGLLGASE